jgi:glutaredoxin
MPSLRRSTHLQKRENFRSSILPVQPLPQKVLRINTIDQREGGQKMQCVTCRGTGTLHQFVHSYGKSEKREIACLSCHGHGFITVPILDRPEGQSQSHEGGWVPAFFCPDCSKRLTYLAEIPIPMTEEDIEKDGQQYQGFFTCESCDRYFEEVDVDPSLED